jgi:uncharacterized damage-inducible protein DinB
VVDVAYCRLLARYNRWMNERLYAIVRGYDEVERNRSAADGRLRRLPRWIAVVHLFNHATHHRGQLTTLTTQAGGAPGVTDLQWLPGAVTFVEPGSDPIPTGV